MELRVGDKRPNIISYANEFGETEQQEVEYEWLPPCCQDGGMFGHNRQQCRR